MSFIDVVKILPQPFAWCEIPAGQVTLISTEVQDKNHIPPNQPQTFDVPAFSIAKYPVTNGQFAKFIEAGGYDTRRWWTDTGWEIKAERHEANVGKMAARPAWTQPRDWKDERYNQANQPVISVSWYEAIAFCTWLSEVTAINITLPTEQQWQRAGQGNDGRLYPWGNQWDKMRCNNQVKPHNNPYITPVTQFEGLGDSPFGVVDMTGNVWEWTLTQYLNNETDLEGLKERVLRGNSWINDEPFNFEILRRIGYTPYSWGTGIGFRLAHT